MTSTTSNSTRIAATLGATAFSLITFLTALVVGWLEVSLQFFGEQADRGDYAVAAGAYGVGAALLLLGPVVVVLLRLPLLAAGPGLAGAVVLACLAFGAAGQLATAEPTGFGQVSWTEGVSTMACIPWNWTLPAMLVFAVATRLLSASTSADVPGDRAGVR